MKKLLLIMGDLAAGKTTFANKLSVRYGVVSFNKDDLKEILANTYSLINAKESKKMSIAAVDIMINNFVYFAKIEKPLILESNFHQDEINRINKLANEYGYDVLTLLVKGDLNVLHKRFVNRSINENRHQVHLCNDFNEFESFKKYIEDSRKELPLGNVIHIDATSLDYQNDEKVLQLIDDFMNN